MLYWVAMDQKTISACPAPATQEVRVFPTPHLLVGFRSKQEQSECMHRMTQYPLAVVQVYLDEVLVKQADAGDIVWIQPSTPQSCSRGVPHMWITQS